MKTRTTTTTRTTTSTRTTTTSGTTTKTTMRKRAREYERERGREKNDVTFFQLLIPASGLGYKIVIFTKMKKLSKIQGITF